MKTKAVLLCAHAQELSQECVIAARHGEMETLIDLQARKQTVIQELTVLLKIPDVADSPVLQKAVGLLREALRAEAHGFAAGAETLRNELIAANAAQRRLTQAQRYDTGGQSLPHGGSQLSVCG